MIISSNKTANIIDCTIQGIKLEPSFNKKTK